MSSDVGLLGRSRRLLRQHAMVLDVALAVGLTAGALWAVTTLRHDVTVPVTVVSAIACTTAVGWRRVTPTVAAIVALTAVVAYQVSGQDTEGAFVSVAIVLTCYWVGRSVASWRRWLGVAGYALAVVSGIQIDSGFSAAKIASTWLPLAVLPIAAGLFVARRDGLVFELRDARARLQGAEEIARARVVAEERTRVARELHDVVAHCVSVMVIQAGAARLLVASDVSAARDALRVVSASGRDALADLRRVVGVRRAADDGLAAASFGLAQLPQLIERARGAGTSVRLHLDANAPLPADLDLAAFRIVQEALTNARKHAPTASVDVSVAAKADRIEIAVEDSGPSSAAVVAGSGHGLVGMRERVALHNGELHCGPTPAGGFAVHARMTLTRANTAAAEPSTALSGTPHWQLTPLQTDTLFSLAWLVPLVIEAQTSTHRSGSIAVNVAAVAAMALAGAFRRRAPLAFLGTVGVLGLTLTTGIAAPDRVSVVGTYTVFVGSYTVAAYCTRARALVGLVVLLGGGIGATVAQHSSAGGAVGGGLMACLVWMAGRIVRNQRALVGDLRAATRRLADERDARALLAAYEERIRIARDLHTIVARLVTTMVVQAEATDRLLDQDTARAVQAIAAAEQTGRQALAQLRHTLGVLRNRLDPAPRRPPLDTGMAQPDTRNVLVAFQS